MPTEIYLLKVGMTMTEGMVGEWYIPDGSPVKVGDPIYRLETEKVELEVDAEAAGTVKHIKDAGVNMDPGTVIGWVYADGEEIPDVLPGGQAKAIEAEEEPVAVATAPAVATAGAAEQSGGRLFSSPAARRLAKELGIELSAVTGTGPGGRIVEADVQAVQQAAPAAAGVRPAARSVVPAAQGAPAASPLARRRADELGIDLTRVRGTGPSGRITKDDVEAAAAGPAAAVADGPQPGETIRVTPMRRAIAKNMHESLQSTAQLTMNMEVQMDDAVRLRGQLVEEWAPEGIKPSYADIVIRTVCKVLREFPMMNSGFGENEIALLEDVNVGMAVAVDEGLLVPVIHNTDQMSLKEIAIESSRLARAAREGKLGLDEMSGGTFTVSALGMFGVDTFTPILNTGQSGILGVNRIYDGVGWDGDRPVKRKLMNLSLTWDHRVLDGAPAAQFLARCRDLLESPYRLLV